jgi:hypothetical protein
MIRYSGEPRNAFMGVGWGKWTEEEDVLAVDSNGNTIYNEDGSPVVESVIPASVNVTYVTAYRNSYKLLETEEYTTDYFYTRQYSYDYSDITTIDVGQQLITANSYFPTGWGHNFEYLVDGNDSTYAHTNFAPTDSKPAVIEMKLNSTITANRLIFDGSHNSEKQFLPKNFKIWVSTDGENWQLVCDVVDSTLSTDGWQVTAMFDQTHTFDYVRIEITATHKQYIALRKIIFQNYVIEISNGNQLSPDNDMFAFRGDWALKSTYSDFGHIYIGETGSTLKFEFEGTKFAILSVSELGANFKVKIDGVEVDSITLRENPNLIDASYISTELKNGKHKVTITCLDTTNIDSIVIW